MDNYEAQTQLFQALRNDEELSNLAKGGFHNLVARKDSDFPRVVYSEINNRPEGYADNEERRVYVSFQISIFNTSATVVNETKMTKVIDRIMKEMNYKKYDSQSLYETDTEIYHKALRYEKNYY